jgi:hypothetical protein
VESVVSVNTCTIFDRMYASILLLYDNRSESVLLIEDGKWEDWSAGARRNGFYCMCHVNPHGVHKATFKKLKIIKSQLV